MYKYLILIFVLVIALTCCKDDTATEPDTQPKHDQALVGTWELTTCKLNGDPISSENFSDCPVKIEFTEVGSGIVWTENYGTATGCKTFQWSTTNDELTIHQENEYPFVSTYTVSNNTLTISFVDDGNVELIYTKQ
ncbi:MAG: lipocalin family protein [Bacteroidota bacterium]